MGTRNVARMYDSTIDSVCFLMCVVLLFLLRLLNICEGALLAVSLPPNGTAISGNALRDYLFYFLLSLFTKQTQAGCLQ